LNCLLEFFEIWDDLVVEQQLFKFGCVSLDKVEELCLVYDFCLKLKNFIPQIYDSRIICQNPLEIELVHEAFHIHLIVIEFHSFEDLLEVLIKDRLEETVILGLAGGVHGFRLRLIHQ
jgi:hypothetical protein